MYLTAEPTTFANPVTTPSQLNELKFATAYRSGSMFGYISKMQHEGIAATYGYKCIGQDELLNPVTVTNEIWPETSEAQFLAWLDSKKY